MSRPPTGQSALGSQRNEPRGQVALVALTFHLQGYPTPSVQGSGLPLGHPKHSDVEAGGLDNFEKKSQETIVYILVCVLPNINLILFLFDSDR